VYGSDSLIGRETEEQTRDQSPLCRGRETEEQNRDQSPLGRGRETEGQTCDEALHFNTGEEDQDRSHEILGMGDPSQRFFDEESKQNHEEAVEHAFQNASKWFQALSYEVLDDVRPVLREAFKIADMTFGEDEAVAWGNEFRISRVVVSQHAKEFEDCDFNFQRLIERFKWKMKDTRMSISEDNPEREKLLLLVAGMPLCPRGCSSPTVWERSHQSLVCTTRCRQRLTE
jgi:hypothetical protein